MKIAKYWEIKADDKIQCLLCPNLCLIENNKSGKCRKRKNISGTLYTETYAQISGFCDDPIEKKPLFHFFPGMRIFSIGANSCNMTCSFCQNYHLSQMETKTSYFSSEDLLNHCLNHNFKAVAFTYSEPLMLFEYVIDTAKLLKAHYIKVVMVSNAYINQAPLEEIAPYIDAWNIDLKSFNNDFYQNLCSANLAPVLNTINYLSDKTHLEIAYLLIPEFNDSETELRQICSYIQDLNKDIPLHINRYYPNYKLTQAATSIHLLEHFQEIAQTYLNYVYLGNIYLNYPNTQCPKCHKLLIDRSDNQIMIKDNLCPICHTYIYGKFNERTP